jgi:hypothetical protein
MNAVKAVMLAVMLLAVVWKSSAEVSLDDIEQLKPWANPKIGQSRRQCGHGLQFTVQSLAVPQAEDATDPRWHPMLLLTHCTWRGAFVFLCEKVGSTAWKALLIKASNPEYFARFLTSPNTSSRQAVSNLATYRVDLFRQKLSDYKIPRHVMRDPYSRVLSGWTEKTTPTTTRRTTALRGLRGSSVACGTTAFLWRKK